MMRRFPFAALRMDYPTSVAIRDPAYECKRLVAVPVPSPRCRRDNVTANLTSLTHPCPGEPLDASSHKVPAMTNVPTASFSPELLILMRSALDTARQIDHSHRNPATKAKMAQRIVRMASEGVTDPQVLMSAAVDEGRVRAA